MKKNETDRATIDMASNAGMSGRRTADELNFGMRIRKEGTFGNIVRYWLSGAAIVLLPLQQATAWDDNQDRRLIPSVIVSSTVPSNGDGNPYGVAFVPRDFPSGGPLKPGDILVSNFNNSVPVQGTGTTIIKLTPNGQVVPSGSASVFFQGSLHGAPKLGLTTALGVLKRGFVLVGNVPTTDGTFNTIQPGSLLILGIKGNILATLTKADMLDSPWDLTVQDSGDSAKVFVSNVVSGTVTRLDLAIINGKPVVIGTTQIANGYMVQPNSAAVILGPTGLAYDADQDVLYVASTADNAIFAVPNAGIRAAPPQNKTGAIIFKNDHLHYANFPWTGRDSPGSSRQLSLRRPLRSANAPQASSLLLST